MTEEEAFVRSFILGEALEAVIGHGMGTLVSCVPGVLGFYEGESSGDRCILARPRMD